MIVSIHQPNYLPWLGTIDKIARSDIFVFFDTVQYEKRSVTNKNSIKTPNGQTRLTIPIVSKGRYNQLIKEVQINPPVSRWVDKHKKTICINYKKASAFNEFFPILENVLYSQKWVLLAELNIEVIKAICGFLQIKTKLIRASDLKVDGSKTEMLVNICKALGATHHLTGSANKTYIQWDLFEETGIKVVNQNFKHPIYTQLHGGFISNLSCIDMLLNLGKKSMDYFIKK